MKLVIEQFWNQFFSMKLTSASFLFKTSYKLVSFSRFIGQQETTVNVILEQRESTEIKTDWWEKVKTQQ